MFAVALVPDNLVKVRDLVKEATSRWFDLGLELSLKESDLEVIKANDSDTGGRFTAVLYTWLKMVSPPPTWEALIAALKKDSVGLPNVANKVEEVCGVAGSSTG